MKGAGVWVRDLESSDAKHQLDLLPVISDSTHLLRLKMANYSASWDS